MIDDVGACGLHALGKCLPGRRTRDFNLDNEALTDSDPGGPPGRP